MDIWNKQKQYFKVQRKRSVFIVKVIRYMKTGFSTVFRSPDTEKPFVGKSATGSTFSAI